MTLNYRQAVWADDRQEPKRRIAFVLAGLGAGGAERVVSLIAASWVQRGHDVSVIAFDTASDGVFHDFDPRVELIRLGIGARPGPVAGAMATVRRGWTLRRTLDRLAPDVTIAFLTKINVLTLLASLGTRRRVIISERNNPRLQRSSRMWTLLLGRLSRRADAIVMQTQGSLACLDPGARARAHVIPNPVCPVAMPRRMGGSSVLAAVGRLTHQKGFDLLVRAFAQVAEAHSGWKLVIWGEGPERGALQRQIDAAGLTGRVDLPGNSRSPGAWVAEADAFVLSSRYEGFSNVLAEAMAGGLPVAAFDCDFSPRDMIDHGRTGLLVANGDPDALARALDRIMADGELRMQMGAAARQESLRYDPAAIMAQWDAVIGEMSAGTARGKFGQI